MTKQIFIWCIPKKYASCANTLPFKANYAQVDLPLNAILLLIRLDSLNIFYYNCTSLLPFMEGSALI